MLCVRSVSISRFVQVPLLLASDGSLQQASSLRWPSHELQALPPKLQRAMLEAVASDGTLLLHPALSSTLGGVSGSPSTAQNARRGKGAGGRGGSQHGRAPYKPGLSTGGESSISSNSSANTAPTIVHIPIDDH